MRVEYDSNNSGGGWWLSLDDWKALEKAGWEVEWAEFLGAPAERAVLECDSLQDAIDSFEEVTGQDADAPGCDCCGRPHSFYEKRGES